MLQKAIPISPVIQSIPVFSTFFYALCAHAWNAKHAQILAAQCTQLPGKSRSRQNCLNPRYIRVFTASNFPFFYHQISKIQFYKQNPNNIKYQNVRLLFIYETRLPVQKGLPVWKVHVRRLPVLQMPVRTVQMLSHEAPEKIVNNLYVQIRNILLHKILMNCRKIE